MTVPEFTHTELQTEIWRDVVGYEGFYSVSNLGRVRRNVSGRGHCRAGRILKPTQNINTYFVVTLGSKGKRANVKVHIIVAAAFLGERPSSMCINHKDGCKANNRADNLEYITPSENIKHAFRNGLKKPVSGDRHFSRTNPEKIVRGERHGNAILKDSDVSRIFDLREQGLFLSEIGAIVGVSKAHVSRILKGQSRAKGNV